MDPTVKIVIAYGVIGGVLLLLSLVVPTPGDLALQVLGGLFVVVGFVTLVWYRIRERRW
jgi:hypothetical protein